MGFVYAGSADTRQRGDQGTLTVVVIAHWWNGQWGSWHRRDVWLEHLDDGRFIVRWRGGGWSDRDGRFVTADARRAVAAARSLVESGPGRWRQLSAGSNDKGPGSGSV